MNFVSSLKAVFPLRVIGGFLLVPILIFAFSSCNKKTIQPEVPTEDYPKYFIDNMLDEYYFWYSTKPTDLDKSKYDLFEYFDASLVSRDRWSWMETKEKWMESETGVYNYTYGASLSQPIEYYGSYNVMVRYVYPGSPFALEGVKRGWTLTHVAGIPVMDLIKAGTINDELGKLSNRFTFIDEDGDIHDFTTSASTVSTRSYLEKQIFTPEDFPGLTGNVGYFNYLTFNDNMLEDITTAFQEFQAAGISDLILDLRYNSGGSSNATSHLANCLAPSSADGDVLVIRQHNDKHSDLDTKNTIHISRNATSLSLTRLFIISGHGSASASEIIINGMRPLFGKTNLIQVGDTTYGKPNGMYVFAYPQSESDDYFAEAEHVFLPICFYSVNKDGDGNYEDGLLPTKYWPDDLYHDWSTSESTINACLTYIVTGAFPALPSRSSAARAAAFAPGVPDKQYRLQIPEDSPHYGRYYSTL